MSIIAWIVVGFIAGVLGKLIMLGRDPTTVQSGVVTFLTSGVSFLLLGTGILLLLLLRRRRRSGGRSGGARGKSRIVFEF